MNPSLVHSALAAAVPAPDESRPDAVDESPEVWSRLKNRIEVLLHNIETPISALFDRELSPEEVSTVDQLADSLARWFGYLGLTVAADLVRSIAEAVTADDADISSAVGAAGLLEDLRAVLADTHATLTATSDYRHHVVAGGEPSPELDSLLFILATAGVGVSSLDPSNPVASVDAVVLPIDQQAGEATSAVVQATRQLYPSAPIVALVADEFVLPPSVLGGIAVVTPASTPDDSADRVVEAIARAELSLSTLVVSINPSDAIALGARGVQAAWCDLLAGAEPAIRQLRQSRARCVVVVGAEVGVMREIAHLIRTDAALRATPLLGVPPTDPIEHEHIGLLRAGYETVTDAGVSSDLLATVVLTSLRRRAILEPIETAAQSNSALPLGSLRMLGERMLVTEARMDRRVSVALLTLAADTPTEVLERAIGPLAREFRRADLTGWHDERSAVVMLPGLPRHVAVQRFAGATDRLGLGQGACRIGISEFPADGRTLTPLVAAASAAIERTIEHAGPVVTTTDWRPDTLESADVLIVDPDPALRAVIGTVLAERGFTSAECADGSEALDYLTGPNRPRSPMAVLIELSLEGIDGIHLLRHLRDAGVLGRFKTLMLASRTVDAELQECFDLGVTDVIRKPFAPLILGQRIARVLEST